MGKNIVEKIDDLVDVRHILISVSDKMGLDNFIPRLRKIKPGAFIYSTGGSYNTIKSILGKAGSTCLRQVSQYTGQPETQGGLVKTLDFKIYLGLLTERYNEDHQADLRRTGAVSIDMVIGNLYPFKETISKEGVTVEEARGNIDIGGPCMIRAAAKNFIRVASVVDPKDYDTILSDMTTHNGSISLQLRFQLAKKAFDHTAAYDRTIADFLAGQSIADARKCYQN